MSDDRHHRDPDGHVFFLSHARRPALPESGPVPASDRDTFLITFFYDLCADVSELLGTPAGVDPASPPGFFDRTMSGSQLWEQEILEAVCRARVFIALLSMSYLQSDYCGKEWCAFSRRKFSVTRPFDGLRHSTPIIPVIWSPIDSAVTRPAVTTAVQRFAPANLETLDVNALYQREGVYGLLKTGQDQAYRTVTWRLAQLVARLYFAVEVEHGRFSSLEELPNIFREGGG